MSNKIFLTFNSYKGIWPYLNPAWYYVLNRSFTLKTKDMINHSGFELRVLAILFWQTMNEVQSENEIDRLFNEKFHDENLISSLL